MNYPFGSVVLGCDAAFPEEEFDCHADPVREALREKDIELLLLTGPENIFYLSGQQTPGYYTFQCLCLPADGDPFLVLRGLEAANARANTYIEDMEVYDDDADPADVLAGVLSERGWKGRRVAIDRSAWFLTVAQYDRLTEACGAFLDGSGIVEPCRAVKTPLEIEAMERAAKATEVGMRAAMEAIVVGASENDVAAAMVAAAYLNGGEYVGMEPFVCSGPRSGRRHATWRRRILEDGDPVTLENAACVNRYHAALFRTGMAGQCKDARMRDMRDACVEGLKIALSTLKPGNTCADVHNAVQTLIDDNGYTDYFRKRSGYSIGIAFGPDWGEGHILSLYHNVPVELEPGMAFHMPISLCDRGRFTVCASETAILTEDGNRVLSSVPRALF